MFQTRPYGMAEEVADPGRDVEGLVAAARGFAGGERQLYSGRSQLPLMEGYGTTSSER